MKGKLTDATLFIVVLLLAFGIGIYQATTFNTVSVSGSVTVPSNCIFSASPTTIGFGSIQVGLNYGVTANQITVTDAGNIGSNIFVYGTNWVYASNSFVSTNTEWAGVSGMAFANANVLPLGSAGVKDTTIVVPQPTTGSTTNSIYWTVGIPSYTPPGSYTQTISISNSC